MTPVPEANVEHVAFCTIVEFAWDSPGGRALA